MNDEELERLAQEAEEGAAGEFARRLRKVDDFRYDEVQEKFWDITTGTLLGGKSVDGAIAKHDWPTTVDDKGKVKRLKPSLVINDVMTGLTVETSTWWPGRPAFIQDYMVTERGAMRKKGAVTYNTYVAPDHEPILDGSWPDPAPWINHVAKLFPDPLEQEHFFDYSAHMIQSPHQKVNHAVVIAGRQGIGKDTALHPLRQGVGQWNATEIEPDAISGGYNPYVQAVMLVINEVRPHDEDHKASNFYNQLKPLLAAPPDMLPMHMKYQNVIYVRNLCHVWLTTNEPLTMYVPEEDRRLFVMTSPLPDPKENAVFEPGYFDKLWEFLNNGGTEAAIKWLLERDISGFNPGDPPPMTTGKKAIIESAHAVRRTPIDELFERYVDQIMDGKIPEILFGRDLLDFIDSGNWFDDATAMRKLLNAKNFHFKMDERGYNMIRCPTGFEWKTPKFRSRAAFVHKSVPLADAVAKVYSALEKRPLEMRF